MVTERKMFRTNVRVAINSSNTCNRIKCKLICIFFLMSAFQININLGHSTETLHGERLCDHKHPKVDDVSFFLFVCFC